MESGTVRIVQVEKYIMTNRMGGWVAHHCVYGLSVGLKTAKHWCDGKVEVRVRCFLVAWGLDVTYSTNSLLEINNKPLHFQNAV